MKDYYTITQALFDKMEEQKPHWEALSTHIMPRAKAMATHDETPQQAPPKDSYSSVANDSLHILASAHLTYITPMDQRWFSLKPPLQASDTNDMSVDDWFSKATEQTYQALATSNFYTTIHEVYLDRCLTGTGCMFAEMRPDKTLGFKHIPTGTYAIAENGNGEVDTIARKFTMTAHQAAQTFGLNALPAKIKDALRDDQKKYTDQFIFWQLVIPNDNYTFGSFDVPAEKRKWQDIYMAEEEHTIVQQGGFYEFPFLVTRYLKYGVQPWGEAPGTRILKEIEKSLNIETVLDTLGLAAAFPRLLTLAEQVGEVDLRAGGSTVISPEAAKMGLPREWGTSGRYDIGTDRLKDKESKIEKAFHVQMLQVISQVDRQMTATEVNAREAEKVLAFNPSFTLFVSDFRVMMQRIFSLLLRAEIYDMKKAPKRVFNFSADNQKMEISAPQIRYIGKIAQAIDRIQRYGMDGTLQTVSTYTQITQDPSMIKCLKPYHILRFYWETSGAPTDCMLSLDEYESMIAKEQEDAEQQAQLQNLAAAQQIQNQATANK